MVKPFFGLYLCLVGKYCENPKVPGVLLNVNLARAITWFVGRGPAEIFSGGGQAMYLLSTGSNKTLQLQPGFC